MNTIYRTISAISLVLISMSGFAQDSLQVQNDRIKVLENQKATIQEEEREFLKTEVKMINERLDSGQITAREAEIEKKEAAKKRALNIENRIMIIDNKIALIKRNEEGYVVGDDEQSQIGFSIGGSNGSFAGFRINGKNKPRRYDKRTTSDIVFAIGFNNAISDGYDFGKSPYSFGQSGFIELGIAWKTRVFEQSNALRLKYGFSIQWNKLDPKDNQYFVADGGLTSLETFPFELRESQLRVTNLVFPVHFEFGPSRKIEKKTYFRYSTRKKFKIGIGGYGGFNIGTQQKLKYKQDGKRIKDKSRRDFNTSDLVYGLSGYVAFGSVGLYAKYDLSPIFEDQPIKQNNISLGLRFDMD